jgi:putative membrane protein
MVFVVALGTGACSSSNQKSAQAPVAEPQATPPAGTTQTTAGTAPAGPSSGRITSGGIIAALQELTKGQIDQSKLALSMSSDQRVKDFAAKVVRDETARLERQNQLMSGLGITPQTTDISEEVRSNQEYRLNALKATRGTAFDHAFLDEQVDYYRMVLDTYDNRLLPNATDPQIKASLQQGRDMANSRLSEAQTLRGAAATQ